MRDYDEYFLALSGRRVFVGWQNHLSENAVVQIRRTYRVNEKKIKSVTGFGFGG